MEKLSVLVKRWLTEKDLITLSIRADMNMQYKVIAMYSIHRDT